MLVDGKVYAADDLGSVADDDPGPGVGHDDLDVRVGLRQLARNGDQEELLRQRAAEIQFAIDVDVQPALDLRGDDFAEDYLFGEIFPQSLHG